MCGVLVLLVVKCYFGVFRLMFVYCVFCSFFGCMKSIGVSFKVVMVIGDFWQEYIVWSRLLIFVGLVMLVKCLVCGCFNVFVRLVVGLFFVWFVVMVQ